MFIIERIENGIVLVENEENIIRIPFGYLPTGAKEGDVLIINGSEISVDKQQTAARKTSAQKRLRKLFSK